MLRRLFIVKLCLAGIAALFAVADSRPASAEPGREQYASSPSPYWRVGTYDERLSEACRRRTFGQLQQYRFTIGYTGEKGQGLTGIASKEWNLYDPDDLGKPGFTYHFFGEGYSNCRVYAAKPKKKRQ